MSIESGRSIVAAPVAQLALPPAGAAIVCRIHVLVGVLAGFGSAMGGPKTQPAEVQCPASSAAIVGPSVRPPLGVQLEAVKTSCAPSGWTSGSGSAVSP